MSVSGMKKQLHKASQLLNERLMGAEGTKLDEDFLKLEKNTEVLSALLAELLCKTTEFLQPNPAYRAKLSMLNTVSRIRGQGRWTGYPQTEGMLGECMLQHGQELGAASEFGGALAGVGFALQQVSQARDTLDVSVKRSFIDPLQELQNIELRDIRHQLKKLQGRRLDFDYKRRRRGKVPLADIQQAWEKFISSKEQAERSMFVLQENDVEQVLRLAALVTALLDFHRNAQCILHGLHGNLQARLTAASNKPDRRYRAKTIRVRTEHNGSVGLFHPLSITSSVCSGKRTATAPPRPASAPSWQANRGSVPDRPCCRALYTFTPTHDGELAFSEGDIIVLTSQLDDNWYEGSLGGQSGFLPISYVDVLVPLPLP